MPTIHHLAQDARMYLGRALNRSLAPPDWLSVNVTLRCNLSCVMCTTCYDAGEELSTARLKDLVDQAALMGIRVFNPLGGEPLVRDDLEDILAYAARKDFHVTLTTNGTLLTPARARRLAAIPPEKLHVTFSLDGPRECHDAIRGQGTFQRALAGYRNLRAADLAAGHPHRKILANVLVHRLSMGTLPAFLDLLAREGMDGAQLLQLFRRALGEGPDPAEHLWIGAGDLRALEGVVARLQALLSHPPWPHFRIQNSSAELDLMARYYAGDVLPLEAPCWAGFKELYVNVDGKAIMCDGNLDFLNGVVGDTRRQTLQEIWHGDRLRGRRRVVKSCRTPCLQGCYLRRQSDRPGPILRRGASLGWRRLRPRLKALDLRAPKVITGSVLTMELTDVCDCGLPSCPTPRSRLEELLRTAPGPIEAVHRDPATWNIWRDSHYVDFGRGFMGLELIRKVIRELRESRMGFEVLALRWRGEPLLHPELVPILELLSSATGPRGVFRRVRLETSGTLLSPDLVETVVRLGELPQEWWLDLDQMDPSADLCRERLDQLLRQRPRAVRLVPFRTVPVHGLSPSLLEEDLAAWLPRLSSPDVVAGLPPGSGDAYWLRRADPRSFLGDRASSQALTEAARRAGACLALPAHGSLRRCPSADLSPTISWDGKVTLCPWDTELENRVGEVTTASLPSIWASTTMDRLRRDVEARGVPGLGPCRDCHQCFSPNHVQDPAADGPATTTPLE